MIQPQNITTFLNSTFRNVPSLSLISDITILRKIALNIFLILARTHENIVSNNLIQRCRIDRILKRRANLILKEREKIPTKGLKTKDLDEKRDKFTLNR